MTSRSPSPSSAMPAAARTPGTVSCSRLGDVEPQPSLMLRPFGEQPIGMISAPRSASVRGTTLYPAPFAQSTTSFMPSSVMPFGSDSAQKSW